MKISPNLDLTKSAPPNRADGKNMPVERAFKSFLDEKMDPAAGTPPGVYGPPPPIPAGPIPHNQTIPVDRRVLVDRTERMLDILNAYQKRLADPYTTLKDLYPMIREIEQEGEALAPVLDSLADEDGLKDILSQVLASSSVETLKFNRGDYVKP